MNRNTQTQDIYKIGLHKVNSPSHLSQIITADYGSAFPVYLRCGEMDCPTWQGSLLVHPAAFIQYSTFYIVIKRSTDLIGVDAEWSARAIVYKLDIFFA